jgi:Gamma tubulin complex component N-terminal
MTRLVDGALVLSGGALASRLHGHGRHGDTFTSKFVQRVMDHVCVPFYNMISRWILYGDLQDPYEEFFVGMNRVVSTPSNLTPNVWLDTYFLRHAMLPSFLPLSLALRILVIGKTINFIRLCMSSLPKKVDKISILPNTEFKPKNPPPQRSGLVFALSEETRLDTHGYQQSVNDNDLSVWLISSIENMDTSLRYGCEHDLAEVVQRIGYLTDSRLLRLIEERL